MNERVYVRVCICKSVNALCMCDVRLYCRVCEFTRFCVRKSIRLCTCLRVYMCEWVCVCVLTERIPPHKRLSNCTTRFLSITLQRVSSISNL